MITGTSRGIGQALAEHFLAAGDQVIGCGRTPPPLEHDRYMHCAIDVTDAAAVDRMFREMKKRFKTLDVLINNAGIASMNAIALTPVDVARRVLETNFLAAFNFTREGMRMMRSSPAARIVNISTVAVPLRLEGEAVYAASKSALETFTRIAAREMAPFGITCNVVAPGYMRTGRVEELAVERARNEERDFDEVLGEMAARIPMGRMGEPEELAALVAFLASERAGFITGQTLSVSGGLTMA
jgi:3-oxoacyl-[acyl-carrier protein] reductase